MDFFSYISFEATGVLEKWCYKFSPNVWMYEHIKTEEIVEKFMGVKEIKTYTRVRPSMLPRDWGQDPERLLLFNRLECSKDSSMWEFFKRRI